MVSQIASHCMISVAEPEDVHRLNLIVNTETGAKRCKMSFYCMSRDTKGVRGVLASSC